MSKGARLSILISVCIITAGCTGFYFQSSHRSEKVAVSVYKTPEESDIYVRFLMEAFDSIQKNYWQKASDTDLANLFTLAAQKASQASTTPIATDRASTASMLARVFGNATADARKQLAINILMVTLYNLAPAGRNGLLSNEQEKQLRQEVSNVNPEKDLYADVGTKAGATADEVKTAYTEKKQVLEKATTTEAKKQLADANYAYHVLADQDTKGRYDVAKVEPTIYTHIIGETLYLYIEKMSPTTLDEFVAAIQKVAERKNITSMILDVRGNLGGSLDIAPYFIGMFMGQNQYTFDLFHQGDYIVERSPIAKLDTLKRFHDIAVLTDGMSQSTSEVIAAALKRLNLAHTVGSATRGWGTVENTYPITTSINASTTYAMLLVQSITLRDDNQPIEGRGVEPDVNTADANWKDELNTFFRSESLIAALKDEAKKPPLKE